MKILFLNKLYGFVIYNRQHEMKKVYVPLVKFLLKKPPVESGGLILEEVESTPPNPDNESRL
jgi:hypothetical protein|tara:strand:- start:124 stop:309 length:186 start_codon:yes stop_codon:yes gene_type:complete